MQNCYKYDSKHNYEFEIGHLHVFGDKRNYKLNKLFALMLITFLI